MTNVEMKVEGNKLIITADLSKEFGLSSSRKSITIATTGGNVSVGKECGAPEHDEVKVGLNIYTAAGR